MRDKRRLRWVIGLVVVAGLFVWYRKKKAADAAALEFPPETAQVTRGEIRQTVVASGIIEPETKVEVKSNAGGEVTELFVDVGDVVTAGDLLAKIDPEDSLTAVRTAGADLSAAVAGVQQSRASLAIERDSYPAQLKNAEEAVKAALARKRQAEENLAMARASADADVLSADESLRAAQARTASTELTNQRDDSQLDLVIADSRQNEIEAAARLAQAEANLSYQRETQETDLTRARQAVTAAEARLRVAQVQAETRPANAAAQVREARAGLTQAEQRLNRLQEATLPENTASVRGEYEASRALLANAETELQRQRSLLEKGFVGRAVVDQAQVDLAAAQGRFAVAEQALRSLGTQQTADVEEAKASVQQAEAALERARQNERDAGSAADDLAAAQAALAQSRAELRAAEAGATQVAVRERELEAAQSALVRAQSAVRQAEARRVEPAVRGHGLTEAQAAQAQAQAQREVALADRRQVAIRAAELEAAQSSLEQARASLRQVMAERPRVTERAAALSQAQASIARREAELSNAQEQLNDTTIVAPRDGVVIERFVEEGTIITSGRSSVTEGTRILTIADITRLYCLASIDEADVAKVQPGQRASLSVESYQEQQFEAVVRKVYPQGVTESDVTLFTVELEVKPGEFELRPGMTAEIEIETMVKDNVLTVPSEAVREGPRGFVVMVDKGGEEPEEVPVEVGIQTFDAVEIMGGIEEGATIIVSMGGPPEGEGNGGPGGPGGGQSDAQRNLRRGFRSMGGGPR